MTDGTESPTSSGAPRTEKKRRPIYACLPCHKRRVKCDHLKPCTPCCLRGTPSQCEFTEEGNSAHMLQSDLIKSLTEECAYLESRLAELESLEQHSPDKGCKYRLAGYTRSV
ncbi:hypothetical protein BDV35DRAFT_347557 [Aspergillus flavus]|uniref:Zn(2)-C6 fungal-type domain-containing protein n=1 Tax=Aspergillus flavus TaxID=5059 RepID=A0A5N6H2T6_ASPFL|nr:hypothetical protein BDV35DRAFT_347557 [Aspergillus flavus]KAF7624512.1 hypothetical protein AFLA_008217 [Aspergillus flavus NRRL3357]